ATATLPARIPRLRFLPAALHRRDFALFVGVVLAMNFGSQMIAVAIGWQVYDVHHRAFDLGLIGLLEFGPVFLLALPGGQLADRVSRRLVLGLALVLLLGIASALIVVSIDGAHVLWPFLVLAAASGAATALSFPVSRALPAMLLERDQLPSGLAIRSVANQAATVAGPAFGGLLFAIAPEVAYSTALGLFVVASAGTLAMAVPPRESATPSASTLDALLGGIRFIGHTPVLLGAIMLDLFAVLFGGAVALLPVFAQSILHPGPAGLGVLRSAPAVGAVLAGVVLVRRPLAGRTGPTLIAVVATFGACMVVFGLSRTFALSLVALAVSGAVDMVSVNIRTTTASLVTPDQLRGRVGAVESVFVGASNQLGAFESGSAAALLGAAPSVVVGGALTIVIAIAWTRLFPSLAALDRMSDLRPPGLAADVVAVD
ncbi:MAG: MFS transporter, partial [Solirubrobacteraceae bacterium]